MKHSLWLLLGCLFLVAVSGANASSLEKKVIKAIRVEPLEFCAATGVIVEPLLVDGFADQVLGFEYRWLLNGEEELFVTGNSFPGERLRRGDLLSVEITPRDRDGSRLDPQMIDLLSAVNSSPVICSIPSGRFSGARFSYQVEAVDPDGDDLVYRLGGAPEGMSIDAASGLLEWHFSQFPEGMLQVSISVEDGNGGRAEQNLDLTLAAKGTGAN